MNPDKYFGTEFRDYQLDTNYRSPKNIVDLSHALICHNENRVDKKVKAYNHCVEAEIEVVQTDDISDRLRLVTEIVEDTEYPGRWQLSDGCVGNSFPTKCTLLATERRSAQRLTSTCSAVPGSTAL